MHPFIVTDQIGRGFFEPAGLDVCYMDVDAYEDEYEKVLDDYQPVGLISIERCGRNTR